MNRRTAFSIAAVLLPASLAQAAEVRVQARCQPAGPVVTLADVAKVTDDDPRQADALGRIELFPAPVGRERTLRARELQETLALRGVDLSACRISGAAAVTVLSDQSPERPAAERSLPARTARRPEPQTIGAADRRAETPAGSVVVAAAAIAKGAVIRADDVRLEPAQSDTAQSAAFQSLDEVVGKAASRAVPAGSVLQAQSVCEATLVRRGEVVTVYVRRDGLRIRTTARAHDDGALGDRITVESMLSRKKKFAARVCGPQEAEVELPGAAADARP